MVAAGDESGDIDWRIQSFGVASDFLRSLLWKKLGVFGRINAPERSTRSVVNIPERGLHFLLNFWNLFFTFNPNISWENTYRMLLNDGYISWVYERNRNKKMVVFFLCV